MSGVPEHPAVRYQALVAALAAARHRRRVATARATERHAVATAAVRDDVVAARQAVRRADQRRAAAAYDVTETDVAAEATWQDLRSFLRRRGRALGPAPEPRAVPPGELTDDLPTTLLTRANRTVDLAARGELPRPMPVPGAAVMLLCGAVGAVGLVAVSWGIITLAADAATAAKLAASALPPISLFGAPFAGIPLGRLWLRWYGRRATPGMNMLAGLAGLVTGIGMFLLYFR